VASGQAPAAANSAAPVTTVLGMPKRVQSRPENGEMTPAVMGPGAMQAAAFRTEKRHSTVSSSVVPRSIAAKPV
jgi:hypothetical protein